MTTSEEILALVDQGYSRDDVHPKTGTFGTALNDWPFNGGEDIYCCGIVAAYIAKTGIVKRISDEGKIAEILGVSKLYVIGFECGFDNSTMMKEYSCSAEEEAYFRGIADGVSAREKWILKGE